jgi:hypothetical protein
MRGRRSITKKTSRACDWDAATIAHISIFSVNDSLQDGQVELMYNRGQIVNALIAE